MVHLSKQGWKPKLETIQDKENFMKPVLIERLGGDPGIKTWVVFIAVLLEGGMFGIQENIIHWKQLKSHEQ